MYRPMTILGCLALAACGPKSKFHDYTTPERAVRSFIEAGRVGDEASIRQSLVADEQDACSNVDYKDIGNYTLALDRMLEGERAVVMLDTGGVQAPVACIMENGEWKVTIHGTLACMQQQLHDSMASAPR